MKKRTFEKEKHSGTSRRSLLQAATVAAIGMMLDPLSEAQPAPAPIDYGTGPGQTPLGPTNVFPLLAGWLLLTTNAPGSTNVAKIAAVANISTASAQALLQKYTNQQAFFNKVRNAFGEVAIAFTGPNGFYSGGQCPETPERIKPVAALRSAAHAPAPPPAKKTKPGK